MEKWRQVWRDGIAPNLPTDGLRALLKALVEDDQALVQGIACSPPALDDFQRTLVIAACAISYAGWRSGIRTVGGVKKFISGICDVVDKKFEEPAASRYFTNWFDSSPREIMRRELIPEVRLEISKRDAKGGA